MTGPWATVPRLLADNNYLVLATADADGRPWATPVFFAAADTHRLYWVSSPDSRHSGNIAARPDVAITIFDSRSEIGAAEALYLEARASTTRPTEHAEALDTLNSRLPRGNHLGMDDVTAPGPLQIYRADVTRHFVLIRGGDPSFDNVIDMRLEVTPESIS